MGRIILSEQIIWAKNARVNTSGIVSPEYQLRGVTVFCLAACLYRQRSPLLRAVSWIRIRSVIR
ncbi:MAG: hypothetical protein ACLFVA_03405 [Dehalococcoidia bacterium]